MGARPAKHLSEQDEVSDEEEEEKPGQEAYERTTEPTNGKKHKYTFQLIRNQSQWICNWFDRVKAVLVLLEKWSHRYAATDSPAAAVAAAAWLNGRTMMATLTGEIEEQLCE